MQPNGVCNIRRAISGSREFTTTDASMGVPLQGCGREYKIYSIICIVCIICIVSCHEEEEDEEEEDEDKPFYKPIIISIKI